MISLSHLNKLTLSVFFFIILTFNPSFAEDEPQDIWKKDEKHENPVSNFEKLYEHKEFHRQLNKTKKQVDLTSFF